jgi:hypothetical protein
MNICLFSLLFSAYTFFTISGLSSSHSLFFFIFLIAGLELGVVVYVLRMLACSISHNHITDDYKEGITTSNILKNYQTGFIQPLLSILTARITPTRPHRTAPPRANTRHTALSRSQTSRTTTTVHDTTKAKRSVQKTQTTTNKKSEAKTS